nr:DUF4902 domain-containing protein [Methylobacter tundripaludum]
MHPENITGVDIITISPDGYIRLTFEEFQQVSLVHLMSGLDEGDNLPLVQEGATFAEFTGYTTGSVPPVQPLALGGTG